MGNFIGRNIVGGRITVNGSEVGPGIHANGRQVKCPCGNETNWGNITMTNDKTTAECDDCGYVVEQ
jgi:hypothetical protein